MIAWILGIFGVERCGNCGRWTADPGGFIIGTEDWKCCPRCADDVVAKLKASMFSIDRKGNEIRRFGAFNEATGERAILEPWQER
jgi:hypothetical protein